MRTIADRKDEIRSEALSTQPLLTNDYTYGNINDTSERISDKIADDEEAVEEVADSIKQDKKNLKPTSRTEMDKMKEKYPVQQIAENGKEIFTVDEIQDSVDELTVGSDTRERG